MSLPRLPKEIKKDEFLEEIKQISVQLSAREKLISDAGNKDLLAELQALADQLETAIQTLIDSSDKQQEEENKSIFETQFRSLSAIKDELNRAAKAKKISKKMVRKLDFAINEYNEVARIEERIRNVAWYREFYEYGSYVGITAKFVTLVWLGVKISLAQALLTVGVVFPPLIYGFIALRALFDTGVKAYGLKANKKALGEVLDSNKSIYDRLATKSSQLMRTAAAMAAFVFNTLAALSFTAVLVGVAFPIFPIWFATAAAGWMFVGAAAVVGWVSDSLVPTQKVENNYKKFQKELHDLDSSINELQKKYQNEPNLAKKEELDKELKGLKTNKEKCEINLKRVGEEARLKSKENRWAFLGAASAVLIACAIIPVVGPILSILGYVALGLGALRGVGITVGLFADPNKPVPSSSSKLTNEATDTLSPRQNKEPRLSTGAVQQRLLAETPTSSASPKSENLYDDPSKKLKKIPSQGSFRLSNIHRQENTKADDKDAKIKKIEMKGKLPSSRIKGG